MLGAGGAMRATGWRATATRFNNCVEDSINQTRAEFSRAREGRAGAVGQRSDPRSDRPAGAACWPPSPILFRELLFGEFWFGANAGARAFAAIDHAAPASAAS